MNAGDLKVETLQTFMETVPTASMGLVYLPTFTIKVNQM